VVVDEFEIFRTSISPDEADTPLHVHADAVLTTTVASQLLQTVSGRDAKIFGILRGVDQFKLPQRRPLQRSIDAFDVLLVPDALGVPAPERSAHEAKCITMSVNNAMR